MTPPAPISSAHELEHFDCGTPSLNDWLKRRALKSQTNDAARTYVVCVGRRVVGYYCLAAGAVALDVAPKPMQRNMPDPIPVIILGRFAVDGAYQGQSIGSGLLKDAILRSLQAAEIVGIKAILVHALSDDAKRYYLARSFMESPIHPMTLCLPMSTARRALE